MKWISKIVGHGRVPASQLLANPFNHRLHPEKQRQVVEASIREIGFVKSVIVNKVTGHIVDGHERAMQALGFGDETLVDVEYVELSLEEEKKALLVLDASSELAEVDRDRLVDLAGGCDFSFAALEELAASMLSAAGVRDSQKPQTLAERFGVVPFSVMSAKDAWWLERREAWVACGAVGAVDPVLCELVLRWFAPVGGVVVDPLSSTGAGVVADKVGLTLAVDGVADLLFTAVVDSLDILQVTAAIAELKNDRFAAVFVRGARAGDGGEVDRLGDVVRAFEACGCRYYNEVVVALNASVDVAGFVADRSLGVVHAMLLIFVKGDPKVAAAAVGPVEFGEFVEAGDEFGEVVK